MTVAFDKITQLGNGTGNISATVTPVGTPRGVLVFVCQNSNADEVSGVTYGGVSMTEVSPSPLLHATGETLTQYCYFLGASVPTGAQTCAVTVTGSTAKVVWVITLTAGDDLEIVDSGGYTGLTSGDVGPSLSLAGRASFVAVGFSSGANTNGDNSPLSGWSANTATHEYDFGSQTAGSYVYDTIAATDVAAQFNQASVRDHAIIGVAISEVVSGPTVTLSNLEGYDITSTGFKLRLDYDFA